MKVFVNDGTNTGLILTSSIFSSYDLWTSYYLPESLVKIIFFSVLIQVSHFQYNNLQWTKTCDMAWGLLQNYGIAVGYSVDIFLNYKNKEYLMDFSVRFSIKYPQKQNKHEINIYTR